WLDKLGHVTFHNALGTQGARVARIAELAAGIAPLVGADADAARKAAEVAKADLASEMVYEFPELQGIMGRYYAAEADLSADIAEAAEMHYKPLGPSDDLPTAPVSISVSMADKLDTLTGFWVIDEKPTGSKDPFALRRAALGIIRTILGNDLRVGLERLIDMQLLAHTIALNTDTAEEKDAYFLSHMVDEIARHGVFGAAFHAVLDKLNSGDGNSFTVEEGSWLAKLRANLPATSDDLLAFFHDRLKVHLRDEGLRHDVIDACIAMPGNDDLTLLVNRAKALGAFLATEEGDNLLQGFKRANNILAQAEEKDGVEYRYGPDVKFAEDASEKALFAALDDAEQVIASAVATEDFAVAMGAMAALRAPIDGFFEAVQVNTDNDIVRRNRLNLLHRIRETCVQVADLTRIEG
uniref:glycine--tRNA ligase subunit beta n=1 Tax=Actibacterium sp. TaxID=1872125 RepID=UPI00356A074F